MNIFGASWNSLRVIDMEDTFLVDVVGMDVLWSTISLSSLSILMFITMLRDVPFLKIGYTMNNGWPRKYNYLDQKIHDKVRQETRHSVGRVTFHCTEVEMRPYESREDPQGPPWHHVALVFFYRNS